MFKSITIHKALLVLSLTILSLSISSSFAQQPEDLILGGMHAVFQDSFSQAESCFAQIIKDSPEHPQGYFFLAALLQAEMMDKEKYSREEEFHKNIQKSIELSKNQIESDPKDAWAYLFLGNSYGYLAVYQGKRGGGWSALKNGLRAKSNFKKAIELDSTLYDAYLGLGSYCYWSSVVTKNLRWLPFFSDKRKEGIELLKITATKSTFSKEAAVNALIWAYINEKWYPLAIKHSKDMCERYPGGKLFLWALATAQYQSSDWAEAYASYSKLLEKIEAAQPQNYHNLIQCRAKMASALFNLENKKECINECEKIFNYPIDENIREKQKDNLELAKRLLEISKKAQTEE